MGIKIAFFNKELPSDRPNGVSCQVHRLANALVDRGHTCTCFSFSPRPDDARYDFVKLSYNHRGKVLKKFDPAISFSRIGEGDFDILHYHGDDYLARGGHNRVRTFYGSALSEARHAQTLSRKVYQSLFYCFEWVSCMRKGAKAGISKATARALPLVRNIIPCGVPLDTFSPGTQKTRNPSILFLGDLNSRKRGDYLLQLFTNDIIKKYPDCSLTVVGPQCCTGTNVTFTGNISEKELIAAYQESWLYCMPSSYEGFGVPAIEAMACGTAVVAVDNPGIREIIRNNYNGLRLNDSDLLQGIDRVLSDSNVRKSFETNGRTVVEKMFDIAIIAEKYERLYLSLLKQVLLTIEK